MIKLKQNADFKKKKRKEVEQANPWEKVKVNVLSRIMVTVLCCEEKSRSLIELNKHEHVYVPGSSVAICTLT